MTTQVKDILVTGEPFLPGRVGDGEMKLDLTKTSRVEILREGEACKARATLKDGDDVLLEVDRGLTVSADTPCGPFRILLERVVSISFGDG